jgi:type IV pilus assembly protein PilY1
MRTPTRTIVAALVAAVIAIPRAGAASVDLSTTPLVTGSTKAIAPNIFFVLDDSSSMGFEYVPDSVGEDALSNCFKSASYNKMYYDPTATYSPPVKINSDGTSTTYAASSFTNAKDDGFCTGGSCTSTNLNTSFKAYKTYGSSYDAPYIHTNNDDTAQQAYYYNYTSGTPPTTCAANNKYAKVNVATNSAEAQNFANWYTYYRKRILMAKSATGSAFSTLDDKYRVGYTVLSETGVPTNGTTFLPISKFNATQKVAWFNDLYAAGCPSGICSTPTRGALAKAGRYYAGQFVSASVPDPIQYSCQQNFTVLVTDGYWNTGDETSCSSSSKYSACKMTGTSTVGDQDGQSGIARPYYDGLGVSNSLADVAYYYWATDLRPTTGDLGGTTDEGTNIDVSPDNVPPAGTDTATWQHMNTFTVGLGVPGVLNYSENYLQGGSSDYNAILQGTKNWPDPQTSSGNASVPARLDDLWHAAVNGRGQYLSVKTPSALTAALGKALSSIAIRNGSGAAAATSNLEPVAGDDYAFVPQYTTQNWTGDLIGKTLDLTSGALSAANLWSAATQLQTLVSSTTDSRTIYTFSSTGTNKLKTFTSANLTTEKAANYFKSSSTNPGGALTQYAGFTSAQQTAATDDAMIAYLRGQNGNEMNAANTNQLFRERLAALGDIVSSKPVYVKYPPFKYNDVGYAAFIGSSAITSRAGTVYVGANDGMLHAFDSSTGNERWAYIPSALIPNLYKLADAAYATNHQFYADGPIVVGDAYNGSAWKTILIAGLGRGGRGYYALDVTDPTSPIALWEYGVTQDNNVGYAYGNPVVTKRMSDGTWVVLFSSGYNNTSPGDGKARLYVVNAFTGVKLAEISANGSVTDPNANGIAKVANWVDDTLVDNSTQYVYAGDLTGNLWKFDLSSGNAQRLGYTSATAGNQPITVKPELGIVKDSTGTEYKAIYFGTGRYLGFSDITSSSPSQTIAQTIYAVKDTGADLGVLSAAGAKLVAQTLNSGSTPRTIASPATVDWSAKNGWYMSLPIGERMNIDPSLQLGTLVIASNIPDSSYCSVGGTSWLYALNYSTGGPVSTASKASNNQQIVGTFTGAALTVGVGLIQLPGGKVVALVSRSDTKVTPSSVPISPSAAVSVRRLGWREMN